MADLQDEVGQILKLLENLRSQRGTLDTHRQEIHDRVWPYSGDFTTRRTEGEKRTAEMYDATAALGLESFAAFLEASLTPRNKTWHGLRASVPALNKDQAVKEWFEEVTRILHKRRESPQANYYAQMHEGYKSLGAYGDSCLFVDEMPGGVRYKAIHIGQTYIVLNHHSLVDSVYRVYQQSAFASMRQWGEAAPPRVRNAASGNNPFECFQWCHLVRPRQNVDPEALDERRLHFESLYIAIEDRLLVGTGGYEELPYLYGRYTVHPTDTYGSSPAMLVLPNIKVANEMTKTFLRAGHRTVDPAILATSDNFAGAGRRFNMRPGAFNAGTLDAQGRELVKPFVTGARLDMTDEMLQRQQAAITAAFFAEWGKEIRENPNMTATQVLAIIREKGEHLGPMAGRLQSEVLGPQIAREVGIEARAGRLPPMPQALVEAQGEYEIEYVSPATMYQRASELEGLQAALETAGFLAQYDPGVMSIFKADEVIRRFSEVRGGPADVFFSPEEYQAARQAQAQQAQMAQMLEGVQGAGKAAKDFAAAAPEAVAPAA